MFRKKIGRKFSFELDQEWGAGHNRKLIIIFSAALVVRIVFHHLTGFIGDDAFITFRYAENLASGLGFVYNPGQPVLGTTTPLFTLILASLGALSMPIPKAALLVSLVASGLTSVVIYRFALSLRFTTLAWLPVLGYMLWPRSLAVDTSGMETALFTLLTTSAFYFQHKRRDIYALAMAALAAVTRPEGLVLVMILLAINLYHRPDRWQRYLSVTGLLLLPWILFATVYFGSPVPNSVFAKTTLFYKSTVFSVWDTLEYFMGWHTPFGWIMFLLALVGGSWLYKKQSFGWLEIIWLGGLVAFYSAGRARVFSWYIGPIYPLYFLFITAAFCWFVDRFDFLRHKRQLCGVMIGLAMGVLLLFGCYKPLDYYGRLQEAYLAAHYEVAVY